MFNHLIKIANFGMSWNLHESHYHIVWDVSGMFLWQVLSQDRCLGVLSDHVGDLYAVKGETLAYSEMEDLIVVDDAIEKEKRNLLQEREHYPDDVIKMIR